MKSDFKNLALGESISMHRRGRFGLERLLGWAWDLQVLRVVFGRASGTHVRLSGSHFGTSGRSFFRASENDLLSPMVDSLLWIPFSTVRRDYFWSPAHFRNSDNDFSAHRIDSELQLRRCLFWGRGLGGAGESRMTSHSSADFARPLIRPTYFRITVSSRFNRWAQGASFSSSWSPRAISAPENYSDSAEARGLQIPLLRPSNVRARILSRFSWWAWRTLIVQIPLVPPS